MQLEGRGRGVRTFLSNFNFDDKDIWRYYFQGLRGCKVKAKQRVDQGIDLAQGLMLDKYYTKTRSEKAFLISYSMSRRSSQNPEVYPFITLTPYCLISTQTTTAFTGIFWQHCQKSFVGEVLFTHTTAQENRYNS